jgi:hypothetical protein
MPYKDKTCRHCGEAFTPLAGNAVVCRRASCVSGQVSETRLREIAKRDQQRATVRPTGTTTCPQCGDAFTCLDLRRKHCSDVCYRASRNEWQRQYEARQRMGYVKLPPLPVRDCELPECGQAFQPEQAHQRYCCIRHRKLHTRRTSYRAEIGKAPIKSGAASRQNAVDELREAMAHLQAVKGHGFEYSGYSESRPREVTSTLTSCPHCRAYGTDTLGRVVHSSWCKEAVAG